MQRKDGKTKRAPAPHRNHSIEDYEKALRKANGFISVAAKALGVSYTAVQQRVKHNPDLQMIIDESKETMLDLAECKLISAIKDTQPWAVCFYLKCQGKERGYVEKQIIDSNISGGGINISIVPDGDDYGG